MVLTLSICRKPCTSLTLMRTSNGVFSALGSSIPHSGALVQHPPPHAGPPFPEQHQILKLIQTNHHDIIRSPFHIPTFTYLETMIFVICLFFVTWYYKMIIPHILITICVYICQCCPGLTLCYHELKHTSTCIDHNEWEPGKSGVGWIVCSLKSGRDLM